MTRRAIAPLSLAFLITACAGEEAPPPEPTPAPKTVELAQSDEAQIEDATPSTTFALSVAEPTPEPTPEPPAAPKKKDPGMGSDDLPGLDAGQIRAPIKRNMGQVKACYERELKKNAGLEGKIVAKFTIGKDGKVRGVRAKRNSTGSMSLARCIEGRVGSWVFPTAPGPTDVEYPFVFEAKDF